MAFGRLERRTATPPMSEINVTPLVDVMLVLLVIFMLTAPLLTSAIRLDLPQAEGLQSGEAPLAVNVALDAKGQLFFNDQPVDAAGLAQQFEATARRSRETEVQLRVDEAVPYGQVVALMGAAQKAGLSRIGFVAQPAAR
ncbi:MAG: ExbD/TolR family protein [Limnohabitans sp.]